MNQVFIGNISYNATEEALGKALEGAGKIISVKILKDHTTGTSRGIGFVEFSTPEEAKKAVEVYNGVAVDGRNIRVDHARPRQ